MLFWPCSEIFVWSPYGNHSSLIVRGDYKLGCVVKSPVVKRSIVLDGHKTSVSLEDALWKGLKSIAAKRVMTLSDFVGSIDDQRQQDNLSSALRLFVLDYYRTRLLKPKVMMDLAGWVPSLYARRRA